MNAINKPDETDSIVQQRLEKWQEKLLDLSLRNPLLSFRGKNYLTLVCPDPTALEDKLAKGNKTRIESFSVQQTTFLTSVDSGYPVSAMSIEDYANKQMKAKPSGVVVDMDEMELRKIETNIYRKARTALLEGGIGTLYLSFGILEWRRDGDETIRRAPLILMPVALERKSIKDGVRIVATDEETRINKTLLEMLSKDFGIVIPELRDKLPEDKHGLDVRKIWKIAKKVVEGNDCFSVKEEVLLGNFSFAKYLMWADMSTRTDILKGSNSVVDHLMRTPNEPYDGGESIDIETLDDEIEVKDLLMPLEADASQTAAVASADAGNNFILVGPPGTGKSQTISNIISHMIGRGKNVLFVAEKLAALEVVHKRLADIGLGQFCLELHSNKTSKKVFLDKLKEASEKAYSAGENSYKEISAELQKYRNDLNMFVKSMHKKRRNGHSAYEGIGYKVKNSDTRFDISLSWHTSEEHDTEKLSEARRISEELCHVGKGLDFGSRIAKVMKAAEWSPSREKKMVDAAKELVEVSARCNEAASAVLAKLGLSDACPLRTETLEFLDIVCHILISEKDIINLGFLLHNIQTESLLKTADIIDKYGYLENILDRRYKRFDWRKLDIDDISKKLAEASKSWWMSRKLKTRKISKTLNEFCSGKSDPNLDVPILAKMFETDRDIVNQSQYLSDSLSIWSEHDTDTQALRKVADVSGKILDAVELTGNEKNLHVLLSGINNLAKTDLSSCGNFVEVYSEILKVSAVFYAETNMSPQDIFKEFNGNLEKVAESASFIVEESSSLRDWCQWNKTSSEAEQQGLSALVSAVKERTIPADKTSDAFESAYWEWWTSAVIDEDPYLRNFSSRIKENEIERFCELDDEHQKATASHIISMIDSNIEHSVKTHGKEWGELKRYMNQKRPRITIRELTERFTSAIKTVTPCWMMSPLSVSQYLPFDKNCFDVVIFDEASQITTWDAIGTLARGKQIIVSGDPKQMPPSSLFQRQYDTEDEGENDEENLDDLESILDEMEAARIPKQCLNFHYRSKKEDLIAFSNNRYYDNTLITFPPANKHKGVSLIKHKGTYVSGAKARTNRDEAEMIIAEIIRRLTHENIDVREQTIGVVTFNQSQQQLIEDLLDNERRQNPSLESAFGEDIPEPVFVKNLENVQGDERDVILFSITYGPDAAGNPPAMRFGPLNREGGQRRLNVAFTRARQEMIIFSSMLPEIMRVKPESPQGVKDLKTFLKYAEHGEKILPGEIHGSQGGTESPLESEILSALTQKGWNVEPQIGVSRYRIDIGVVHPEHPGDYLAGIECDGATYHSSRTAKERDKLRQDILEGLGWTLFRIWSTDWWHDRDKSLEDIHEKLQTHLHANNIKKLGLFSAASAKLAVSIF